MKTKLVALLSLLAGLNAKFTVPHLKSRVVIIAHSTAWINSQRGLLLCSGLLTSLLLLSSLPVQASNESTATDHQELLLSLNAEQRQLAGIEVSELSLQAFNLQAVATAQLIVDKDKTITIAPQLDMQILKRHVVPGEQVTQGQPLLTIGGADIAAAKADYINAATEWDRIKRMTLGTISASQRMQIEVNAELKRAILQAIMMTPAQIKALAAYYLSHHSPHYLNHHSQLRRSTLPQPSLTS